MTVTTHVPNGRARKSLADQIDRLDGILDGLADGLNEAVAAVVQESVGIAVREAVQAVLGQLLSNPAVLARLQGSPAPASTTRPAATTRVFGAVGTAIGSAYGRIGAGIQQGCRQVHGLTAYLWHCTCQGVGAACNVGRPLALFRLQLVAACGVGVAAGAAAYFAGPWLAAVASGIGAFATTLAVQIGWWLRRTLEGLAAAWD